MDAETFKKEYANMRFADAMHSLDETINFYKTRFDSIDVVDEKKLKQSDIEYYNDVIRGYSLFSMLYLTKMFWKCESLDDSRIFYECFIKSFSLFYDYVSRFPYVDADKLLNNHWKRVYTMFAYTEDKVLDNNALKEKIAGNQNYANNSFVSMIHNKFERLKKNDDVIHQTSSTNNRNCGVYYQNLKRLLSEFQELTDTHSSRLINTQDFELLLAKIQDVEANIRNDNSLLDVEKNELLVTVYGLRKNVIVRMGMIENVLGSIENDGVSR